MTDEDDFFDFGIEKSFFDGHVRETDILRLITQITLNKAFNKVENKPVSLVRPRWTSGKYVLLAIPYTRLPNNMDNLSMEAWRQ